MLLINSSVDWTWLQKESVEVEDMSTETSQTKKEKKEKGGRGGGTEQNV